MALDIAVFHYDFERPVDMPDIAASQAIGG